MCNDYLIKKLIHRKPRHASQGIGWSKRYGATAEQRIKEAKTLSDLILRRGSVPVSESKKIIGDDFD